MASSKACWLLAAILAFVGCEYMAHVRVSQDVAQQYVTGPAPRIVVETFNGKVHVQRGADNEVKVTVSKVGSGRDEAAAQEDLANVEVTMIQEQNEVRITAKRVERRKTGNSGASVHLTVPPASHLELATSNGNITTEEITGTQKLRTHNGAIKVAGGLGELSAYTNNGAVTLDARNAVVNARTSNGRIDFRGTLASGEHSLETSNGGIGIVLPNDAEFAINASTSNGSVTTDFALKTTEKKQPHTLKGSIGDHPAARITAKTSNGAIAIRRDK